MAKTWIDDNVAAYPVLWIYPWQKLYPCAFTAGTWLCFPFDQVWDICLMMPVHLVRALWDYVSCQDICSPQEVKVLRRRRIYNDRLHSLLCSRRSYFVLMSTMGCVGFVVNLVALLEISNKQVHFRQAASRPQVYPEYYCTKTEGDCPINTPDIPTLASYSVDMVLRLYGIIEEAVNKTETIQAICEWFGGLVSLCCSVAALSYWTSFSISRKFCLMGWICMMLTPAVTSTFAANSYVNWEETESSLVTASAEVWEDISLFVATQPCQTLVDYIISLQDQVVYLCSFKTSLKWFAPEAAIEACNKFNALYGTPQHTAMITNITDFCTTCTDLVKNGPKTRGEAEAILKEHTPSMLIFIRIFVGIRGGMGNMMRIIPAVVSMVPALMQGGLMVKNLVPRQTMPSILTTLPWAYTIVVWVQYQVYYQLMNDWFFLIACLLMSFGPMVYYIYGKYYDLHQPMDDQQSITITFRIWYYALICGLIAPYVMMVIYITWFNNFLGSSVYQGTIGWLLSPSLGQLLAFLSGTVNGYAYTLQAGIDWFVDELCLHHMASHAPMVFAATETEEEAYELGKRIHTQIDLPSITSGTYVCGGLSDPDRLYPPTEGTWQHKAKTYAISLARKDFATLDALTAHIRQDNGLPEILDRGRRPWYKWMDEPNSYRGEPGGATRSKSADSSNGRMHSLHSQAQPRNSTNSQAPPCWGSQRTISRQLSNLSSVTGAGGDHPAHMQSAPNWGHQGQSLELTQMRDRTATGPSTGGYPDHRHGEYNNQVTSQAPISQITSMAGMGGGQVGHNPYVAAQMSQLTSSAGGGYSNGGGQALTSLSQITSTAGMGGGQAMTYRGQAPGSQMAYSGNGGGQTPYNGSQTPHQFSGTPNNNSFGSQHPGSDPSPFGSFPTHNSR